MESALAGVCERGAHDFNPDQRRQAIAETGALLQARLRDLRSRVRAHAEGVQRDLCLRDLTIVELAVDAVLVGVSHPPIAPETAAICAAADMFELATAWRRWIDLELRVDPDAMTQQLAEDVVRCAVVERGAGLALTECVDTVIFGSAGELAGAS